MKGHVTCRGGLLLTLAMLFTAASARATIHDIQVGNNFFAPLGTVVQVGDTVRWVWDGGIPHSVTSENDSPKIFDSGISSAAGFTFQIEIMPSDGPGPFPYFCQVHAATMKDTIFVADPVVVPPGLDLFMVPPDFGTVDSGFIADPIPENFFNPGSEPFEGRVYLTGAPLPTNPPNVLDPASVAIARKDTISVEQGQSDQVPIEIVALSLVSAQPITVTYNGGQNQETWEVRVVLSNVPQPEGSMGVTRGCDVGGSLDLDLPILPKYIFTQVDPPGSAVRTLESPTPLQLFLADSSNWVTAPVPFVDRVESDGSTTVDHDLDIGTPNIPLPPTDFEFFAGPSPLDCLPEVPPVCFGFGLLKEVTDTDISLTLQMLPAVTFLEAVGASELQDGRCVITTQSCSDDIGGVYLGDGTTCFMPLVVPPGCDLFVVPPESGTVLNEFVSSPIPADFFNPGSDPFDGQVPIGGSQLSTNPPGILGPTSVVVERKETIVVAEGGVDVVPIEIVALSLTSVQPITVTYNGGQNPELWDVRVVLADIPQPEGSMSTALECQLGGKIHAVRVLYAQMIFTQADPPGSEVRTFVGLDPLILDMGSDTSHFSIVPAPFATYATSDGDGTVDHDANPLTPDIPLPPTNPNFFAGTRVIDCLPGVPPLCFGLDILTGESVSLPPTRVDMMPAATIDPATNGAAILADGSCVVTTEDCALLVGATYLGDGTLCFELPPNGCCEGLRGNLDGSPDDTPTLGDLTVMIDHLFISLAPLDCWEEGNVDESIPEGPGSVTLGDLTVLIDNLFISLAPPPACP